MRTVLGFISFCTLLAAGSGASAAATRDADAANGGSLRSDRAPADRFKAIYQFDGSSGASPQADLIALDGNLYGTTAFGGARCNCGTVFRVSTAGEERVLYRFQGQPDGAFPVAALTSVDGTLYGTTSRGGLGVHCTNGCGTIYSLSRTGTERVLHRFSDVGYNNTIGTFSAATEGFEPVAPLLNVNGMLYGTTSEGGSGHCQYGGPVNACGTIYSVTTAGILTTLYSFSGISALPSAGLTMFNGTLYGTALDGGIGGACRVGCGYVFNFVKPAQLNPVYEWEDDIFSSAHPLASLIVLSGALYGTTSVGGYPGEGGAVFSVTSFGSEQDLHRFGSGTDGAKPLARLIAVDGVLYGTTSAGGRYQKGTVFALTTSGVETILHDFTGGADGAVPQAGLTYLRGALYGTATTGGAHNAGTIFRQAIR